ncbi:putative ribonuclease H-like domain-containing protein [Tanacetum coccineum]
MADTLPRNEEHHEQRGEEVAVLKREVACKDYEINVLKSEFEKVKQEKEGIEFKIEKFDNASKSLNKLLESQITDKSKKGLGYNAIPPPHPLIYNRPKKLDLSYSGLDEFKDPEFKSYGSEDSKQESNIVCDKKSDDSKENSNDSLVKEQVSKDTSSFVESSLNVEKETVFLDKKIEFVKPKNHEKPVKKSVRYAEMYRSQSPRGNQRNWNGQKSNQLGSDFVMYNKACFICGSFDHVQAHCKYHQRERMVYGNNYNRVNYNYTNHTRTHPNAQRNMVPRAVLMKTGLKPFNTARTVNTAHPKSIVFSAKPMSRFSKSAQSTVKRPYQSKTILTNKNFTQKNNTAKAKAVNTARPKAVNTARPHSAVVNVVRVNQANVVKASACWVWRPTKLDSASITLKKHNYIDARGRSKSVMAWVPKGTKSLFIYVRQALNDDKGFVDSVCSRHMTRNIAYLSDFKEFDGGYVTFRGEAHGGKQHRASCKSKVLNPITKPLFMLHMDLFGPTFVSSLMHKKYCLVVTDDYSRFTWVFFLTSKDETSEILKNFIKVIENLVDKKVKIIRSDNGTEFKNKVMDDFCREKGIKREYSVARTPQQNGVAERRNRTLIEAARTMLVDSKLPTTFWAEVVSTACYVQNRVLVVKPHNKTPYELFKGKFDGKSDEENKPMIEGTGPKWLFNIDSLTQSMNYVPVTAGTVSNDSAVLIIVVWPHQLILLVLMNLIPKDMFTVGVSSTLEATHIESFSDEDEPEVDLGNITNSYTVPTTPNTRIHKDHPIDNVIGDVKSYVQTRRMIKPTSEQGFLSDIEPTSIAKACLISIWVETMQEELLPYSNFKGLDTVTEEGIVYEEVFALVARIKAIRLFLAYASFMGFLDLKILTILDKVYKVGKALYGCSCTKSMVVTLAKLYVRENGLNEADRSDIVYKEAKRRYFGVKLYADGTLYLAYTTRSYGSGFEKLMKE